MIADTIALGSAGVAPTSVRHEHNQGVRWVIEAANMLAQSLARYAQAIEDGRYDEAVQIASHLPLNGDLAVIHPAFLEKFRAATPSPEEDPKQSLVRMAQLLRSIAEAARGTKPPASGRPIEPIIKTV